MNTWMQLQDFRSLLLQMSVEIKTVTSNYEKMKLFLEHKVSGLEDEKVLSFLCKILQNLIV